MEKLKEKIFALIVVIALAIIFIPMLFNNKNSVPSVKDLSHAPQGKVETKALKEPQTLSQLKNADKEQGNASSPMTGTAIEKEIEVAVNAVGLAPQQEDEQKNAEEEKAAKEKLKQAEEQKLAQEKLTEEKLEKERQEKLAQEKLEKEKLEKEKLVQEKLTKEKEEKEKLAQEKREKEKEEKERLAQEKLVKEKEEKEKLAQEKLEKEKLAQEKREKEKEEKERLAQEKLVKEKEEKEKLTQEKLEKEKLAKETLTKEKEEKLAQEEVEQLGAYQSMLSQENQTEKAKAAKPSTNKKVKTAKETKKAKSTQQESKKMFSARGGWVVQLGTFAFPEHATALVEKLRFAGYPAYTRELRREDRILTMVFVGPVIRKEDANKLVASFQAKYKVKGIVIRYEPI